MWEDLEQLLQERREWREQYRRRQTKVSERCVLGFQNLAYALHHEIVRHNELGKRPKLGIRLTQGRLEVHQLGHLPAMLTFALDEENGEIVSQSPLYEGSSVLSEGAKILAAFLGSVMIMDRDGRMLRMRYEDAAEFLLRPVTESEEA